MFKVINENLENHQTDALIIGLFEENKESQSYYQLLNGKFNGHLDELVQSGDISNKEGSVSKVHTLGLIEAKRLYFVGLGKRDAKTVHTVRNTFGKVFKQLAESGVAQASIQLNSIVSEEGQTDYVEAIAEAMAMAPHQLQTYHTDREEGSVDLANVQFLTDQSQGVVEAANTGYALGNGANIARHLVNLPGNLLTASDLAAFAENIANKHDIEIEVFDHEKIKAYGMGALLAVNQGSDEPPRFIVMKYQGKDTWDDPVAFVGKGITFDTGGYSLKPKDGIIGMKMDMGGAASVIGAMDAIGHIKPKENIMALIPATDNMISHTAYKPDDVIVTMSGKTVEVRNTDAEGRLAMADAVTYARQNDAAKIVDVATLTGGVVVALGDQVTGAMTNNEKWFSEIQEASEQVDEPIWQLPYLDVYKKQVRKSHIADLNNSPGRKAHAVMAGAFVGAFAEDTPWVHLDIAGTAMAEGEHDLGPKGPTGVMARTLAKAMMNVK
ncbi:leucyl aminopeptidase [Alkalibacillus haloalkaliphilus]|uniref:leucyl aminopeptidase n=1 Tax=Alkalibacillus haloalkaliphilus TaxID=94136 RepID=UPI0002E9CD99|nr:leucyl aminopeptidase [Alkalibacillus haloalkaliphilus]